MRYFKPYSPGIRKYPPLSQEQIVQLKKIPSSNDGYPCKVVLKEGIEQDFVYIVDAEAYIRAWGVWPDQDKGKQEIHIEQVELIVESTSRLPPTMAQRLYAAGESGMGYVLFEVSYKDGSRSAHIAGNAVDFIQLPVDKTMNDISDIYPHAGREAQAHLESPNYFWCLFGKGLLKNKCYNFFKKYLFFRNI
jgi:hypothetical protein